MFDDIDRMIGTTAQQRLPIHDAMQPWLQYCRKAAPDLEGTWNELSLLDFDGDFLRLTEWATNLLRLEPPTSNINGLWFGLFNPVLHDGQADCQFYLSGSSHFDKVDPNSDWHCVQDYWPNGRYAQSEVLTAIYRRFESIEDDENYLGECCLCQGYVASVIANWCSSKLADQLMGADRQRAVAMGHDSGGMYFIHQPQ